MTVVFLTLAVLAQGGGVFDRSKAMDFTCLPSVSVAWQFSVVQSGNLWSFWAE